jgi:hypothetical protein
MCNVWNETPAFLGDLNRSHATMRELAFYRILRFFIIGNLHVCRFSRAVRSRPAAPKFLQIRLMFTRFNLLTVGSFAIVPLVLRSTGPAEEDLATAGGRRLVFISAACFKYKFSNNLTANYCDGVPRRIFAGSNVVGIAPLTVRWN